MAEITNNTLAVLVFAALAVVLAGSLFTFGGSITGFAPTDTGIVNLTIAESLHIIVESQDIINFGSCAPRAGSTYWCASNDTVACDGVTGGNCSGDTTTPQYIAVRNIGNINANVNVSSTCDASALIGGTGELFQFVTSHCENGSVTGTWTDLGNTTRLGCSNLTVNGAAFRLYANVSIPSDAAQSCPIATLYFLGTPN